VRQRETEGDKRETEGDTRETEGDKMETQGRREGDTRETEGDKMPTGAVAHAGFEVLVGRWVASWYRGEFELICLWCQVGRSRVCARFFYDHILEIILVGRLGPLAGTGADLN
jgi:hypothetical protein